jgi:hypothetical protein
MDYMGVQSIFGLFLQLNWKEKPLSRVEKIYVKTSFNIPLRFDYVAVQFSSRSSKYGRVYSYTAKYHSYVIQQSS